MKGLKYKLERRNKMDLKNENTKNKKSKLLDYIMKDIEDEKNRKEKLENRVILILSFLGLTCATLLNSKLFEIFFNFFKGNITLEEKIIAGFFILLLLVLLVVYYYFLFQFYTMI